MSFQQVTLVGNVGREPESRYTPSGKLVVNFSLAVNEGSGDNKSTLWVRVAAWEKLAEIVTQYVTKGKQVLVVGRLAPANAYLTKDGKPAASYEVTAQTVRLLGGRDDGHDSEGSPTSQVAPHQNGTTAPGTQPDAADIPF